MAETQLTKTPADLLAIAVSQDADVDKLKKLMDLQLRWEESQAQKDYVKAMTDFKKNAPEILKDREVDYTTSKGRTNYRHATLFNVTTTISEALSKYGLSASWKTDHNGKIKVTCRITHINGHFEETSLSADPDSSGGKNSIQAIGSTVTYLERYTLLALTGLAAKDMDDDGNSSECVDAGQAATIESIIDELGDLVDLPKFLKYMKVEKVAQIKAADYENAVNALNRKRQ